MYKVAKRNLQTKTSTPKKVEKIILKIEHYKTFRICFIKNLNFTQFSYSYVIDQ